MWKQDETDLILPTVSLNMAFFRVRFLHVGVTIGMWRSGKSSKMVSKPYAEEI